MKPLLSTLTPEQIDSLIDACEDRSYQEAARFARETLHIQISPASLCRLYTTHRLAEDQQAREDYANAASSGPNAVLDLTESQLQLRLLELASRPNPGASDLRALFHIVTRIQALRLSERRVVLAEKRESRMAAPKVEPPKKSVPPREVRRRVRNLLGKEPLPGDEEWARENGYLT